MDLSIFILQFHIFGAISLSIFLLATVGVLVGSVSKVYKLLSIVLALNTVQLAATGTALILMSPEQGILAFCAKMVMYLIAFAVAEYILIKRLQAQTISSSEAITE